MTLLGFFATIIICGTVLGGLWLILHKPFTIIKVNREESPLQDAPTDTQTVVEGFSTPEKTQELDQATVIAGMDAVIQAANEIMGIQPQEDSVIETRKA